MSEDICKICGNKAEIYPCVADRIDLKCFYCGRYLATGSFYIEDYSKDKTNFYKVSSWIREQNDLFQTYPIFDHEKFKEIINMKDKKIKEKFDFLLALFANAPQYISLYDDGFCEIDGQYIADKMLFGQRILFWSKLGQKAIKNYVHYFKKPLMINS